MATAQLASVPEYYRQAEWQYDIFWSREYRHYGIWATGIRTHKESLECTMNVMLQFIHRVRGRPLTHADTVLDAGCGTGASGQYLQRKTGCEWQGLTISPHQVALAKRRYPGLHVFEGDMRAIDAGAAAVEVVWALESMSHLDGHGRLAFLNEAHRVLRRGGVLVIGDHFRPHGSPLTDAIAEWCCCWRMTPRLPSAWEVGQEAAAVGFPPLATRGADAGDFTPYVQPSSRLLARRALAVAPVALAGIAGGAPRVWTDNWRGAILQRRLYARWAVQWLVLAFRKP